MVDLEIQLAKAIMVQIWINNLVKMHNLEITMVQMEINNKIIIYLIKMEIKTTNLEIILIKIINNLEIIKMEIKWINLVEILNNLEIIQMEIRWINLEITKMEVKWINLVIILVLMAINNLVITKIKIIIFQIIIWIMDKEIINNLKINHSQVTKMEIKFLNLKIIQVI